jgi:hypothetical protein
MSWCEITVMSRGPERCPELSVEVCFSYDALVVESLKASIHHTQRAYDEESHTWWVGLAHLGTVTTLALRFDEARLVEGNRITLLHSNLVMEQGSLFDEQTEGER